MAINDSATLVIGAGNYLTAPVGTDIPTDLLAPGAPWTPVGHTSLEDIFGIASDGGDATTLGSLQNKSLRTTYSARTETLTFTLLQFDADGLRLFYGANAPTLPNGMIGVPLDPQPTECAFLAIFIDGENFFGVYAPKSEVYRADDLSVSDAESLAGLPLGVKPLALGSNRWTYAVTPLGGIAATGATAGTPGAFTPAGAATPADLAALSVDTADPATPWTRGQYVILGDASTAYWNGTTWVAGKAT